MFHTLFKKQCHVLLSLIFVLIAIGGCRSAVPVARVDDEPFFAATKDADLNQITQKILETGRQRKFGMKVIAAGHIEAFYAHRNARAVMDIKYTTKHFSIIYKDSSGLKYNKAANTISSHYNTWVKNLKADLSNIYPLSPSADATLPKSQDKTRAELIPPKPELTDSI
jgi:hypothetical protein